MRAGRLQSAISSADRQEGNMAASTLLLLLHIQFVHHTEGLQELVKVDAAVLVEVDAAGHVINGLFVHGHAQVRAEQLPGLTELFNGNET